MNTLVVGAGEMGRWLADCLDADADTAFVDVDPDAAESAAAASDGRALPVDTDERFDAVAVAVPMSAVPEAVERYADNAERAMFDVSGEMSKPLAAMADHAPDVERGSFHPLFAPPRRPGTVAYVPAAEGPVLSDVRARLIAAGNDVFETTAGEHDEAMETVQARAHAAVLAFALAAEDVRPEFHTPVSAGLMDLVETVTEGSPGVYAEIQSAFDGADDVADAAARIADADGEAFEALYREARDAAGTEPR